MSTNVNAIKADENQDYSLIGELYEWTEAIVFAFVFVILLFTFVFRVVGVEGVSMKDTLNKNLSNTQFNVTLDRVIITNFNYVPKQGDIIVLAHKSPPDKSVPYIKRIIALAGQTVDIKNGDVYVDGIIKIEKYILGTTESGDGSVKFPATVPKNCVFVMGDNREHSSDSRFVSGVGMLDVRNILGKAVFRIFPFNQIGVL
jgi:signal peptidase I